MTQEEREKRRFGRIRGVSESVADAARTVTGHSTASQIEEFTDAYTDVLTGLNSDVRMLQRRIAGLENEAKLNKAKMLEPVQRRTPSSRLPLVVGTIALAVASVAFVIAVIQ